MRKTGWLIGALMLPLAACSNSDGAAETPAGKSGLSSTLLLSGANDAEKLQFCNWLVSVAPTDACGAPSASSPDGGVPVAPDAGTLTAAAYCLATFARFDTDCSVQAAEQCFSTWETSGACKVPAAGTCAAYQACAKATPPKNDAPPTEMECNIWSLSEYVGMAGTVPYAEWTEEIDWLGDSSWVPSEWRKAAALCNSTFPGCEGYCEGAAP